MLGSLMSTLVGRQMGGQPQGGQKPQDGQQPQFQTGLQQEGQPPMLSEGRPGQPYTPQPEPRPMQSAPTGGNTGVFNPTSPSDMANVDQWQHIQQPQMSGNVYTGENTGVAGGRGFPNSEVPRPMGGGFGGGVIKQPQKGMPGQGIAVGEPMGGGTMPPKSMPGQMGGTMPGKSLPGQFGGMMGGLFNRHRQPPTFGGGFMGGNMGGNTGINGGAMGGGFGSEMGGAWGQPEPQQPGGFGNIFQMLQDKGMFNGGGNQY